MHGVGPYRRRLFLAVIAGACAWLALLARLAEVQIVHHERYAEAALRQQKRRIVLPANRGSILDRRGEPLAVDVSNPSLCLDPKGVTDREATVRELCRRFGLERARMEEAVSSSKRFAWVTREFVGRDEAEEAVRTLPGVFVCEEQKRLYPSGRACAHIVGFTNTDGVGLEGIEKVDDAELRGQEGWTTEYVDARGRTWRPPGGAILPPRPGASVVLTIDRRFQEIAEQELHRAVRKADARGGIVVIVDPRTGEILALANEPCYDPEAAGMVPPASRRDRAITDLFEPGSTFKIVTASAAIEERRVRPETEFDTGPGVQSVSGVTLHDAHAHGTIPFKDVIAYSSNIGTAKAALLVGQDDLYRCARRFGFGLNTGIDLPGEVAGVLRPTALWSGRSLITVAIGQEVSVTALQLVMAFAALANGGVLMRPYVTRAVLDGSGKVLSQTEPQRVRRVVSEETARTVSSFLRLGVEQGTGKNAHLDWCPVAGKTGTAQKFVDGSYRSGLYTSSFCGFLPADDPEIVCLVVIDEPHGAYYGGTVAAPVFRRIVSGLAAADAGLMARYERELPAFPPGEPWSTRFLPPADSLLALIRPEEVAETRQAVAALRPPAVPPTQAIVVAEQPPSGTTVIVPELEGLTAREAYRRLSHALLEMRLIGSGRVVCQEPPAGTPVTRGQVCVLHLDGELEEGPVPGRYDSVHPVVLEHGGL